MINLVKGEKVLSQEDKIDKAMFQEFVLDMIQELKQARNKEELLDMLDHFKNRAKNRL